MDCVIGRILELHRNPHLRIFGLNFVCLFNCPLHPLFPWSKYQFGSISLHNCTTLYRHRLRHNQHNPIAQSCTNHRQTNSSVTRGWLNNHRVGRKNSSRFCIPNHRQRNSIFYAPSWILAFQLYPNFNIFSKKLTDL